MKKNIPFLLLIFIITKIFGQDYKINFTGSGASNIVDSVKVENITQCTNLSLIGADTLHLLGSDGLNELNSNPNQVNIYPNPSITHYFIEFNIEEKANVIITIYNLQGLLILEKQEFLIAGKHCYQLNGLSCGVYLIKINAGLNSYSTKIISNSNTKFYDANIRNIDSDSAPAIQLLETKYYITGKQLEETLTNHTMQYTTGDRLKITGYSGGIYATIVVIVPTQSQTLPFDFISCTDVDGNHYSVVKIGTQWWMAENLKTTKYRNGNTIPNVTNNTSWRNLTTGAYCNYNNDINKVAIYGRLYNWFTIDDSRGIAPLGWHVPSLTEMETLFIYFDSDTLCGGKMKSNCTSLWNSPNAGATNESGFSGIPGGFRSNLGVFQDISIWGIWWYATSIDPDYANVLVLFNHIPDFGQHLAPKKNGLSVRCIKD